MTAETWETIRYYQGVHDRFHEDSEDPSIPLTNHIDLSCGVCNASDSAQTKAFQNFWILVRDRFEGNAFTNHTITEFEKFKTTLDQYNRAETKEDKNSGAQQIFLYIKQILKTIRYGENPETDLDDSEYIIVNTGVRSNAFTQG